MSSEPCDLDYEFGSNAHALGQCPSVTDYAPFVGERYYVRGEPVQGSTLLATYAAGAAPAGCVGYDPAGFTAPDLIHQLRARVAELELALSVGQEKAWLAARQLWEGTPTVYACIVDRDGRPRLNWTQLRDEALRFSRRADAEAFISTICATLRTAGVTSPEEHVWQT